MGKHVLFSRRLKVKDWPLYVLLLMHPSNGGKVVFLKPCNIIEELIEDAEEITLSWSDFWEKYEPAQI